MVSHIIVSLIVVILIVLAFSAISTVEGATTMDSSAITTVADKTAGSNSGTVDTDRRSTAYNIDNVDLVYHDTLEDLNAQTDTYVTELGYTNVIGPSGQLEPIPMAPTQAQLLYYQPGSYPYGATSYVPNYEDSVYLSRLTGQSSTMPIYGTPSQLGGFCKQNVAFPDKIEESCNSLNLDTCASTSCCVLLGGQKCVAGGANGPTMQANYSDRFILNKDYYYYQGKCYGNCSNSIWLGPSSTPSSGSNINIAVPVSNFVQNSSSNPVLV
jgi:hypothetical protein